jgi:septal ring factor EnvC (AmiA/AmiB activator)
MRKERTTKTFILIGLLFTVLAATAQADNSQVTNDKKLAKLLAKVSEDSVKLVKFRGMISQFEKDKKDAADQAQQSADDNKRAADRLADNPQDKRLARRAHSSAKTARSDSQKARVAANKLDDLNSDIKKLDRQLGKERDRLSSYQAARVTAVSEH